MTVPVEFAPLSGVAGCQHRVQFYEDDTYLLDEVASFFGAALDGGGVAVVIATPGHREALADVLTLRGLSPKDLADDGRYVALDAAETLDLFLVDGHPDTTRFDDAIGRVLARAREAVGVDGQIVAFGEMVALLYAAGNPHAAVELEQLWNDLARRHTFSLHCAYPLRTFARAADGSWIEDICAAHSHVMPAESFTILTSDAEQAAEIARLQQKAEALAFEVVERKCAEDALAERNRQLAEAVAVRDTFLTVAAHELKTPLTGIRLGAELVQRILTVEPLDRERVHSILGRLDAQTAKLARMVEQLLDVSRLQQGRLALDRTEVDVSEVVTSAVESVRTTAPSREIHLSALARLVATVDAMRLEQAVANLVDNAVKYSPDGGPVDVELTQVDDGAIRLAVRDRGVGIPPECRERVFEPFYRVPSHDLPDGMGLGLHITRQIIDLHGGRLSVETPDDGGTRFVMEVPLHGASNPSGGLLVPNSIG
jgi:signal transduction histidine kinase